MASSNAAGVKFNCFPEEEEAPVADKPDTLLPYYNLPSLSKLKWTTPKSSQRHKDDPLDFMSATNRKEGLWSPRFLKVELGLDRNIEQLREGQYAGLRNLGATCYANALLQALYAIKPFRYGIYSIPPIEEGKGTWLRTMQVLFAEMEEGVSATCKGSVEAFIKACKLDSGVQEDTSELATMLFSTIESAIPSGSPNFIQDIFCGSIRYSTQCNTCGNSVHRSERLAELRICLDSAEPLRLEESLARTFEQENFSDYQCLNCSGRGEAVRVQKIEKCPEHLCIIIQRYMFENGERRRLAAEVDFPLEDLDLTPFITDEGEAISGRARYRCTGVLEHHGASANSGHYTATLLTGEAAGGWMAFNDERVEPHEWAVKESAPKKRRRLSKGSRKKSGTKSPGEDEDACTTASGQSVKGGSSPASLERMIDEASPEAPRGASKTAYMLVYAREDVVGMDDDAIKQEGREIPKWLREEVDEINQKVTSEIQLMEQASKAVETAVANRKSQLTSVMSTLTALGQSSEAGASLDSLYFIPSQFVSSWCAGDDVAEKLKEQFGGARSEKQSGCVAVGESPVKATNGNSLCSGVGCSHGKVDPLATFRGAVKVIPAALLQPEFEAAVTPASEALCFECCSDLHQKVQCLRELEETCVVVLATPSKSSSGKGNGQRKPSLAVINKTKLPSVPIGGTKAATSRLKISLKVAPRGNLVWDNVRFWRFVVNHLVRGAKEEVPEVSDLSEGLVCPHGKTSNHAEGSQYVSREIKVLEKLLDASEQLAVELPGALPKLQIDRWVQPSEPLCPECTKERLEAELVALEEKEKCKGLLESGGKVALEDLPSDLEGSSWSYLLPKRWFTSWREYLSQFGDEAKKEKEDGPKKARIDSVREIYYSLMYCQHGLLRFDPRGRGHCENKWVVVLDEEVGKYLEKKYVSNDGSLAKVRRDGDKNELVLDPPVCDKGCCTSTTETSELLSLLPPSSGNAKAHMVYDDIAMQVRRGDGTSRSRGGRLDDLKEVSSECTGYDLKMLLLGQSVIDQPPQCFRVILNTDQAVEPRPIGDDEVMGDICHRPKHTSIYVHVFDESLSFEDRCPQIFKALDDHRAAMEARKKAESVDLMEIDDDDDIAVVSSERPSRPARNEGGLQGSIFRDLPPLRSPPPPQRAAEVPSGPAAAAAIANLSYIQEEISEVKVVLPGIPTATVHGQTVLEEASQSGIRDPNAVTYRGLTGTSLARYLVELQRKEVQLLKAQRRRMVMEDAPPEDAHPVRALTALELREASFDEAVVYVSNVMENGDYGEVERGLIAVRQKLKCYSRRDRKLEGICAAAGSNEPPRQYVITALSDTLVSLLNTSALPLRVTLRVLDVLSAMEGNREEPDRPSAISRVFAPLLAEKCMLMPPSEDERVMRAAAELMTEWISKQGDDGIDDPLRDSTINCLLASFLHHGPDHLPCIRLLETLFTADTITDSVDLPLAAARELRVLLDTKVNSEIRLGRFAYAVILLTGESSGGSAMGGRLRELGVDSTLRQMPLLEADSKEEAKWARDQVELALASIEGSHTVADQLDEEDLL
ncbi:hypothetical protein FOL47_002783 [Perkinsus chesapeaki]|uniref:ubiquitinyl hydrolase 1 n=1 Tax=Perkinsus chesapeaki TaxID=330153 RepID=A0A7J6N1D5_PERCH|nr:hypothetical protein FOL47_002783 [Perkinsus chesapeaki]